MTEVAAISEYTYHGLSEQKAAHLGMPIFVLPDDASALFRQTRRSDSLEIYVLSFGILAKTEGALKDFATACKKRKANIFSHEDNFWWKHNNATAMLIGMWRSARVKGAAKIGARISADNKKAKAAAGVAKIKDRWPQPSGAWPTQVLLDESGLSLNTAKKYLGPRPIAQYNYQAAQKRKERRNVKAK